MVDDDEQYIIMPEQIPFQKIYYTGIIYYTNSLQCNMLILILLSLLCHVFSQPTASDSCLNFNSTYSYCTQCAQNFYLLEYFCVPCAPLCKCSSMSNYCESCITTEFKGYNISSYYSPSNNRCYFCNESMQYCLTCSSSDVCEVCYNGLLVDETTKQCGNDSCSLNSGCEICLDRISCKLCKPGYSLEGSQCISYNCSVSNCLTCAPVSQCQTCKPQFFVQNGGCTPCISNCLLCTNSTNCQVCSPSFNYVDGTCMNNTLSNCIYYASDYSACALCQPGYYISGGSCNQCSGCELCIGGFLCLSQCQEGFVEFNYNCMPADGKMEIGWQWKVVIGLALALLA